MAREAIDVCMRMLTENNNIRFDCYSVRNSVLIISHINFWDCSVHIFLTTFLEKHCVPLGQVIFKWGQVSSNIYLP